MADPSHDGRERGGAFLHRWSRRKHEAARGIESAPPAAAEAAPKEGAAAPAAAQAPVAVATPAPVSAPAAETPPLPPVDSLTIDSDFTPFLSKKVDETVKRAALRKLFSDPHFNVMDGLDVYIDDYSKPDPVPPGFLDKLADVYKTVEEKTAAAQDEATDVARDAPIAAHAAESEAPAQGTQEAQPAARPAGTDSTSPDDEHRG